MFARGQHLPNACHIAGGTAGASSTGCAGIAARGKYQRPKLKVICVWCVNVCIQVRVLDDDQKHDSSCVIESIAQCLEKVAATSATCFWCGRHSSFVIQFGSRPDLLQPVPESSWGTLTSNSAMHRSVNTLSVRSWQCFQVKEECVRKNVPMPTSLVVCATPACLCAGPLGGST